MGTDIFFFTDVDLLEEQTAEQAFGPLPNELNGYDCFRYTDRHTFSNDANAYAICKGKILVQPVAETELVNIVLKPEVQPCNCPPVKFYIYRGIRKESLIENDFVAKNTCTLAKSITTAYPEAPKRILGVEIPENVGGVATDYLETAFYRSYEDFELWSVNGGWSIGKFDAEYGGFEIMLDRMCFNPTFSMVRGIDNICQVEALTGNETEAAEFDHWHQKEDIHNYLDPAALFGNQFDTGVKARTSNGDINSDLTPKFETKKKEDIYTQILQAGHFHNKNTIYVDIRNELNYSFNYLGTYSVNNGTPIRYMYNSNDDLIQESDYYRCKWPIYILNDFPQSLEKIDIFLPIGDNKYAAIYVPYNYQEERTRKLLTLLDKNEEGNAIFQSNPIEIQVPQTTNEFFCLCFYIQIRYLKQYSTELDINPEGKNLNRDVFLNYIFPLTDIVFPLRDEGNVSSRIFPNEIYVDGRNSMNIDYVATVGYATDDSLYSFFLYRNIPNYNPLSNFSNLKLEKKTFIEYVIENKYNSSILTNVVKDNSVDVHINYTKEKIFFECILIKKGDFESIKEQTIQYFFSNYERVYRIYLCLREKEKKYIPVRYCIYEVVCRALVKKSTDDIAIETYLPQKDNSSFILVKKTF